MALAILWAGSGAWAQEQAANTNKLEVFSAQSKDGKLHLTVDYTEAKQLEEWLRQKITPVTFAWYPRICELLGVEQPASTKIRIKLRTDMGGTPAWVGGGVINLNAQWTDRNRDEAVGCIVHELTHIVQAYPGGAPGWLVEGIADYIRWFLFEPQSRGALLNRHNIDQARYDASYRISANFLDWVCAQHGQDGTLLQKLNRQLRHRRYTDAFWHQETGASITELNQAWLQARRAALPERRQRPQD